MRLKDADKIGAGDVVDIAREGELPGNVVEPDETVQIDFEAKVGRVMA